MLTIEYFCHSYNYDYSCRSYIWRVRISSTCFSDTRGRSRCICRKLFFIEQEKDKSDEARR